MGNQTIRRCRSQRKTNPSCHLASTYTSCLETSEKTYQISLNMSDLRLPVSGYSSKVTLFDIDLLFLPLSSIEQIVFIPFAERGRTSERPHC